MTYPFNPVRGGNQIVNTSGTSQSISLPESSQSVRVVNNGSLYAAHIRIGNSTQTATTADTIILPGESLILRKGQEDDTLAYIQVDGSTELHVQPGEGGV